MEIMQESLAVRFGRRVRMRTIKRMNNAMTYMVATAWAVLFDHVFDALTGGHEGLGMRLLHALVFTLIAIVITMLSEDDEDD